MHNPLDKDSNRAGLWSASLFVLGLLGPFIIALTVLVLKNFDLVFVQRVEADLIAIWFCFVCQILSLVFGIVGRRTVFGKVGFFGSTALLLFFILMGFLWWLFSESHNKAPELSALPCERVVNS
jgi:hypothetical protein